MAFSVRSIAISIGTLFALALLPAGASALTITSIQDGGYTNANPVVVSYNDADTLINYTCALSRVNGDALDPPELKACSSTSVNLGALTEGGYHLQVQAIWQYAFCVEYHPIYTDQCIAMSTTSEPRWAVVDFTVDRTAPTVSLTGGPDEGSSSTESSASFGITASDGTVACKLDGTPFSCGTTADLSGLSPGAHQVIVTATDQAGNTGTDSRSFTVTATGGEPGGGSTGETGPTGGTGEVTKVTPAITSTRRSVKLGKKIRLGVTCPDGCRIAVKFKGPAKSLAGSITVRPGATSISYSISKSAAKAIRKALKAHKKVTAVFTPTGGASKKVAIKL